MRFLRTFGIGAKQILPENQSVQGLVTAVKTCWWLKVNQSPVRTHALEGAAYPHLLRFTYAVAGKTYRGSRFVNWNVRCPQVHEKITVYYDRRNPAKYAVQI